MKRVVACGLAQGEIHSLARRVRRDDAANPFALRPGTIGEPGVEPLPSPVRCEEWRFYPHLAATHTETVRHVCRSGPRIDELPWPMHTIVRVVGVDAQRLGDGDEHGPTLATADDAVIAHAALHAALEECPPALAVCASIGEGLAARAPHPPYFTREAMEAIVEAGVQHLLFTEFSVDRTFDDGELLNHRRFWGLDAGKVPRAECTITEQIVRPPSLMDGDYPLILAPLIAPTDASPSIPLVLAPAIDPPAGR